MIYRTEKELKELDGLNIKYKIYGEVNPVMYCYSFCDNQCINCDVYKFNEKSKEGKWYEISFQDGVLT